MPLKIEVVSEHKSALGDDRIRQFGAGGGTIGRSLKSDWTLPDPDNYVSGRHCTIDYQAGAYYLADTSTNGVYINGEKRPIGKGNPRRLYDGDQLRMGDFAFVVSLDEGLDLDIPESEPSIVIPDHSGERVPEEAAKSAIQLLDEEEITGDDAFRSTLMGSSGKSRKIENEPGLSATQAVPLPDFSRSDNAERHSHGDKQLLAAFIGGLGIERTDIHPSVDLVDLMENAGNILREFVSGTSDLLACRTAVKNLFKIEQTMVLPQYNNPLKVSEDERDSLLQLLIGKQDDHLAPVEAVRQVCRELKFHHDALLGAMTTAFLEFADRLDPDELSANFDGAMNKKSVFKFLNQLRYWQMYSDLYPIMTQPGAGQFPHQFGETFVRAYAKYHAEYKYLDGPSGDTQAVKSVKLKEAFAEIEALERQPVPEPPAKMARADRG